LKKRKLEEDPETEVPSKISKANQPKTSSTLEIKGSGSRPVGVSFPLKFVGWTKVDYFQDGQGKKLRVLDEKALDPAPTKKPKRKMKNSAPESSGNSFP
jgi:hypothetical protein